ncbi:MAG: VanZ family protein [Verrucomicrobiota bacterium]|nr:VanZ family protein [Verrucomicrobiota bacterium]
MSHHIKNKIGTYILPISLAVSIFVASSNQHLAVLNVNIPFSADKLLHLLIFGLLATLILRTKKQKQLRIRDMIVSISIVSTYGILDEMRQSFTPGRSVELGDWIADTIGAFTAVILYGRYESYRNILEYRVEFKAQKKSAQIV